MVVPSKQPPGWLGAAAGPSQFPSLPLKATTKNHTTLPVGTHSGLADVASPASQPDCFCISGEQPHTQDSPPELPASLPSLTLP